MKRRIISFIMITAMLLLALPVAAAGGAFEDVSADDYFASAVDWAVSWGVTNGTSETTFSPDATMTRARTTRELR